MSFLSSLTAVTTAAPTYLKNLQDLLSLFGAPPAVSPVPALFSAAEAGISSITSKLTLFDLAAEAQVQAVKTANPNILAEPTQVPLTVWKEYTDAVEVLLSVNTAQRTLAAYSLEVSNWNARNSGSLTPEAVPAVPTSLVQYQ